MPYLYGSVVLAGSSRLAVSKDPEIHRMRRTYAYQKMRKVVLARDRGICWICGTPGAGTVDHVVPLSRGGALLDPANMRAAHRRCNSSRGASVRPVVGVQSRTW